MFGKPDPINKATHKLDHIITKYNADFNEYAAIIGFDERALYTKYYKGMAPRIKDGLVFSSFVDLRAQVMNRDLRYWKRKYEGKY